MQYTTGHTEVPERNMICHLMAPRILSVKTRHIYIAYMTVSSKSLQNRYFLGSCLNINQIKTNYLSFSVKLKAWCHKIKMPCLN